MTKRRSKDIGTDDCRAVARAFGRCGFGNAEQRNQHGAVDLGDVVGMLGLMVEVKGGKAGRTASDGQVRRWMTDEVNPQTVNAGADYGFLVTPRAGIGPANAESWWCHFWLVDLAHLSTGRLAHGVTHTIIARILLSDAAVILRAAGYGDPLEES